MSGAFIDNAGVTRFEGTITGASGAANAPTWAVRTLTSPEILDLEVTPVEIVAAPGAGKFLAPILHSVHYRPGATPYVGDPRQFVIGYGAALLDVINNPWADALIVSGTGVAGAAFMAAVTDAYSQNVLAANGTSYLDAAFVDQPLALAAGDGVGMSAGDGTLTVSVLYATLIAATT